MPKSNLEQFPSIDSQTKFDGSTIQLKQVALEPCFREMPTSSGTEPKRTTIVETGVELGNWMAADV